MEVTALTAANYSEETIYNALNRKRTQLPDTVPSIIICVYPEGWLPPHLDPRIVFAEPLRRFFRGSRRVNAVVFMSEIHIEASDKDFGGLFFRMNPIVHPNPRLPVSLDFLYGRPSISTITGTKIENQADMERLVRPMLNSEFYRWVDLTIGRE